MQQVIEGMMGIFFAVLLVFTGMGIARAMTGAGEALAFKGEVIRALEDSDYSAAVMESCLEGAAQKNYQLTIELFLKDGSRVMITDDCPEEALLEEVELAQVTVGYPFEIKGLGIAEFLETTGVAG